MGVDIFSMPMTNDVPELLSVKSVALVNVDIVLS